MNTKDDQGQSDRVVSGWGAGGAQSPRGWESVARAPRDGDLPFWVQSPNYVQACRQHSVVQSSHGEEHESPAIRTESRLHGSTRMFSIAG